MPDADLLQFLYGVAIGIGAGGIAGVLAALAGVGGGLIYVPIFYAFMPASEDGIGIQIMASMLAIILTGSFSARSHYRLGHIDIRTGLYLLPGLIVGAAIGLWSTLHIPETWVLLALAALDLWVAYDYGREVVKHELRMHRGRFIACSGPIGFASGSLGIAGGTMLVPLMRRSLPLRIAVGTSAFCGVIMAGCSVGLNLLFESSWKLPMQEQLEFILGALTGILLILPKATGWSASLHVIITEHQMRLGLKALFVCIASLMLLEAVLQ